MYPHILHLYGSLWINSYGAMIAIGLLVFTYLTYHDKKRAQYASSDIFFNLIWIGSISALIGGRLLFVIENLSDFSENWMDIFHPWMGGLSIFGAIIALLLVLPLAFSYYSIPLLPALDIAATNAPLFHAFGRIGCFFAGCCVGTMTQLPWAIYYTHPDSQAPLFTYLHPTQLYAALISIMLFFFLLYVARKHFKKNGSVFLFCLGIESISRFMLDFIREDHVAWFSHFSLTQLIALALTIYSALQLLFNFYEGKSRSL